MQLKFGTRYLVENNVNKIKNKWNRWYRKYMSIFSVFPQLLRKSHGKPENDFFNTGILSFFVWNKFSGRKFVYRQKKSK